MQESASVLSPAQSNRSSDKLLSMLEVLSEQSEPLHLQGISQLCNVNPSTALRFLSSLRRRNYVAQTADTGKYYLTFKICSLAQSVHLFSDMRNVALPYLRNAAHLFSESCSLAIDSDMTAMYIEVVPGPNKQFLSLHRIGSSAPLHCTAVGKLLLATYSPERVERLIATRGLEARTEHTITDPDALESELESVRKRGYALDDQECEYGTRCLAVPIRDHTGKICAAIGVSGPSVRMTDELIFSKLTCFIETAEQISFRLGWTGRA